MPKVADIVSRALRIIRVTDSHDSPPAQDMADGIAALNSMMRRWEANGLALGWSSVDGPDDQAPLPDEALEAVAYNLALKLRPEYGAALEPDVIQTAAHGLNELRRDVKVASPLEFDRVGGAYNTYTDSYC